MTLTAVATAEPESENWRETMPIWAHQRWWLIRKQYSYNSFKLVSFLEDPTGLNYLLIEDPDGDQFAISIARH